MFPGFGIPLLMQPSAAIPDVVTGILAYWKLDSNSNDSVGSNNGTDTAVTYSAGNGKVNNGAGFDGSTSKIILSSISPAEVSVAAWFRIDASVNDRRIFSSGWENYPTAYSGFGMNMSGDRRIRFFVASNTGYTPDVDFKACVSTNDLSQSVWYHAVGTFDGAELKIYVNGVLENTVAWTVPIGYAGTIRTRIGSQLVTIFGGDSDNHLPWNGALDEIGVWNRALTAPQVSYLYNSGNGRTLY